MTRQKETHTWGIPASASSKGDANLYHGEKVVRSCAIQLNVRVWGGEASHGLRTRPYFWWLFRATKCGCSTPP